jgi:hypothetical protein
VVSSNEKDILKNELYIRRLGKKIEVADLRRNRYPRTASPESRSNIRADNSKIGTSDGTRFYSIRRKWRRFISEYNRNYSENDKN